MKQLFQENISNSDESSYITILRALAIFSVVCAHVTDGSKTIYNLILSSLGSYGVAVFFLLSGYFFYNEKRTLRDFLKRKTITIFIPWMFCGTMDWLYVVLRKGGFSLSGWISSLFVHSHYYYLTVLMVCYALLWVLRNNKNLCFGLAVVSLISMWMTGKGFLPEIYPYTNAFNWIMYFVIGIELARNKVIGTVFTLGSKLLPWTGMLCIFAMAWIVNDGYSVSYWYHGTVVVITLMSLFAFGLSEIIMHCRNQLLTKIILGLGSASFTIYLIHMPFAGVCKYLFDAIRLAWLQFTLPFIVLGIVYCGICLIKKLPITGKPRKVINTVLGIRS